MAGTHANGDLPLRPNNTARPSADEIKHKLEVEFLAPPSAFSAEWLNRLQQRWDDQVDYTDLCQIAPTQSRTVTRFTREGLEGRVTGYKEVTVPASSATAKNSTSMLRRPAQRADFVRGAAGYFPFAPGGLDGVDAIQAFEDAEQAQEIESNTKKPSGLNRIINLGEHGGLLQIPPGFTRGLKLEKKDSEAEDVEKTLEEDDAIAKSGANGYLNGASTSQPSTPLDEDDDGGDDLDLEKLLPVEFPSLAPHGELKASSARDRGREWAHVVDINKDIPNFHELVPDMARTWPFELDVFQKEAVYHLENGDSVFVAAHTSAGKTVVAEYAIALSAKHMTKTIYTSPIKALSNQKFRDFKNEFDDVGILTGDVQINPEASCLIMTTEILRSMLYRGADLIRDVEFVIFDEVHYLNDAERGVVWEEVIIMLPDHVNLILLSATIPNTYEFASWVGRTKKKNIYVISTSKRPVPLEHYLWAEKDMHKIVDAERKFIEKGWKAANDVLSGADKIKEQKAIEAQTPSRGAPNIRAVRGGQQQRGGNQRGGPQRGGSQQRGRGGQNPNRGHGNIARTGRGGGRTTAAQDRTIWIGVVDHLKKENLLPACIFVFSKKRCEENADSLGKKDFCIAAEKSAIHMTIEKSIARLKPEDRTLPQIGRLRDMLERGIAVHHGGLLPIVKEIVEILFARTLVKVLFATETFAMGLNLPTRTVVFSGYRKHDGREFRNLLPGEYTQMAGRAGRRGLDTVGTVIIVASGRTEAPPAAELRAMILGQPTKLRSQFRLHYNMILNLMRVEALKIEEMIKRSFSENATQALLPQHEKQISLSEANLDKIKREPCSICDVDLAACHAAAEEFNNLTKELYQRIIASPVGRRIWSSLRLIVFQKDQIRMPGILLEDGLVKSNQGMGPRVRVLAIQDVDAERNPDVLLPFLPAFQPRFKHMTTDPFKLKATTMLIPLEDVELVTHTRVKAETVRTILNLGSTEQERFIENEFLMDYNDWAGRAYDEQDWNKVTELSVRELLAARAKAASIAQNAKCLDCPDFLKHYTLEHDAHLIRTTIASLRTQMSDQNLSLLPDYHQRVAVLADLRFISSPTSSSHSTTDLATTSRVELKGKVACEIHSADELVLTELILENVLADYTPQEIVALLSSFVFQEKTDIEPRLSEKLKQGVDRIVEISERVNHHQIMHQVILGGDEGGGGGRAAESNSAGGLKVQPRFGLVEVVYNWADGVSFREIMGLTDVMEGTIVRVVTRLDETCREVMSAARLVGDPGLYGKMESAREMIRRDVVFTASLYM